VWGLLVSRPLFSFLQPPIRTEPRITLGPTRLDAPAGLIRTGAHSSGHVRPTTSVHSLAALLAPVDGCHTASPSRGAIASVGHRNRTYPDLRTLAFGL
jgi:hypothetical protein